jgi:hypothetical protein
VVTNLPDVAWFWSGHVPGENRLKKFCQLVALVLVALSLATGATILAVRAVPTPITVNDIKVDGNRNTLLVGDYIGLWGTPTSFDRLDDEYDNSGSWMGYIQGNPLLDLRWPGIEIDVNSKDFNPYSTVLYTNQDSKPGSKARWRGFVNLDQRK